MTRDGIYGVSALAERIKFDRWGFLFFAIVGSVAIVVAKAYNSDATYVAIAALAAIVIYAVIIRTTLVGRLRSDQAGDNCYYLGLIYTLSSLAYAIFTFDPNNAATTIVQGFGIALATTIGGLILRVFFNQTRVDLADVEDNARFELAEAANQLKGELGRITVSMNDFSRQTLQSLAETQNLAKDSIRALVESGVGGINSMTSTAATGLNERFAEITNTSKKLAVAAGRVVAALDSQGDSIETLNAKTGQLGGYLDGIVQIASSVESATSKLTEQMRLASGVHEIILASADSVKRTIEAQAPLVRNIDQSLVALQNQVLIQLQALKDAPGAEIGAATDAIVGAAGRLGGEIDRLVLTHKSALDGLKDQLQAASQAVHANNAALEADLAKSQSNVSKVHTALVEMTETLAQQVERRSQP